MIKFAPGEFFQAPKAIFEMKENPYVKLVALYLYRLAHNDPNNSCYPGYGAIAKNCGISRRSAMRSVSHLENLGVIVRSGNPTGKYGKVNIYHVNNLPSAPQSLVPHSHQCPTDTIPSAPQSLPTEKNRHEVVPHSHPINNIDKQIVYKQGKTGKTNNNVGRARQAPKGGIPLEPPATVAHTISGNVAEVHEYLFQHKQGVPEEIAKILCIPPKQVLNILLENPSLFKQNKDNYWICKGGVVWRER